MMSGQKCKEEDEEKKKNNQNAAVLVPNGKLGMNSLLQRSQVDSHSIQHTVTLFQKYISFLETTSIDWKDSEKRTIINILKHRFEKADPSYLLNEDFEHLILSTMADMKKDVNCFFVCIKNVTEELKSYRLKSRVLVDASIPCEAATGSESSRNEASSLYSVSEPYSSPCLSSLTTARSLPEVICVDTDDEVSAVNSSGIAGHPKSESKGSQEHNHCEVKNDIKCFGAKDVSRCLADGNVQQTTAGNNVQEQTIKEAFEVNSVGNSAFSHDKRKHIQKLERLMQTIHKKIKKLQKKELTLEEMSEESDYILEDKLKKKFVKVWEEWCKQVGRSSKAGYQTQKPFRYEGSRYKSVNVAVEKFQNKKKSFPDFCDILNVVRTENTNSNICLTETQCHNIAEDIFSDVGKTLKERRCRDYIELSGCYLTDVVNLTDDPADHDVVLKLKLDQNRKDCEVKLDKLIENYVQMQEEKSNLPEDVSTSPDEDDEDDDLCSKADEEASSCSSDEVECDDLLSDSLKVKGSPAVIPQNISTKAFMKTNLPTPDTKTNSLSDVTCTSSSHVSSKNLNSDELSTLPVKLINSTPKQETELRNVIQTETDVGSINHEKSTLSVCNVTSSQNNSEVSNILRTNNKIKVNSLACGKTSKLKFVSSGGSVIVMSSQNDCTSVDTVPKVHSLSDSVVNSSKTSQCMKSVSTANGPSEEAEEIWISSSDSDASTSDVKTKFSPESASCSKSIPQLPSLNVARTKLDNSNKNFHQSSNSNQSCALKAVKRHSSVPIQKQNHIPDKKRCLSPFSKKS